ncbi:MAG: DUF2267 domain-containing protein [Thermodesulfobacteriota bacterium]
MQPEKFFTKIQNYSKISDRERCKELCGVVFKLLSDRLTENESKDLKSQLPSSLKDMWIRDAGRDVIKFHKDDFLERVMKDGKLENVEIAEDISKAVFKALKEQISYGETEDVNAQLPKDLKEFWMQA